MCKQLPLHKHTDGVYDSFGCVQEAAVKHFRTRTIHKKPVIQ